MIESSIETTFMVYGTLKEYLRMFEHCERKLDKYYIPVRWQKWHQSCMKKEGFVIRVRKNG